MHRRKTQPRRVRCRGVEATYFESPAAFRAWLEQNHETETELLVGYHKVGTGKPSMTWSQSVDEALCFGWIDGVRRRVDDERYTIRFTPRRPGSHWSRVNVEKVEALLAAKRMRPAGVAAYEARREDNTARAPFERSYELDAELQAFLEGDDAAWAFWQAQPPGYQRSAVGWVMLAKRSDTRKRRMEKLVAHARAGERVPNLVSPARRNEPRLDAELQALLDADEAARAFFQEQTPSVRKRTVAYVMDAKKPETRLRRMEGLVEKARKRERWW